MSDHDAMLPGADQLGRMFELSRDLLCIANTEGYFERVNPSFKRLLGYEPEELLSRRFIEFVHPDDVQGTLNRLAGLAEGEVVIDFKNRYRAKDGSWHWLAWRSAPAVDGLIYAAARDISKDIEKQRLIEQQAADLARSNADLEEFAYAASHDLQAPLRALIHLVSWIRDDMPAGAGPGVRRHLDEMSTKVGRMQELIDDLLAYSRVGKTAYEVSDVDVAAMVAEITDLLSPPPNFVITAAADLPTLATQAAPLHQVLRNLIANAIRHHDREAGRVTISAVDRDTVWEFRVSDDGPGIPEHDLERVFMRFVSLDAHSEGSGMGLALVKKIVERGGGKVAVESTPGEGATFSFTWPKSPRTAES
jgi:PAS domain S-box-containing protein